MTVYWILVTAIGIALAPLLLMRILTHRENERGRE